MYNTLGSSRLPVMSVGSSSSRSGPLRALALEPAGSLRAPAVPAAGGLRASPAAFASAGATPAAGAAAGVFLLASTAGSRCSGRGRARAGELLVVLEGRQRAAGVCEIEIRQHAEVPPGRCIARIRRNGPLVRGGRVLELAAKALGGAELAPRHRAAGLVSDRALQGFLRLVEVPGLALQNGEVHQGSRELRVLHGELLEAQLRLQGVAGTHVIH